MKIKQLLFIIFLVIATNLVAQKDSQYFIEQFEKGTKAMLANKVDSSIYYYESANNWLKKNKYFDSSKYATQMLSHLGRCYRLVEKPQLSQDYLMMALTNARKYQHKNELSTILIRLNYLHQTIAEKNWTYNYTIPKQTKTQEAYFQIKSITPIPNTDSVEVKINAGFYDGIWNKNQSTRINSRIIQGDTLYHQRVVTITSATFFKIENNQSYLHIPAAITNKVMVGDFVTAEVEIPIEWSNLLLHEALLNNDILINATDAYYNYRFFYYYGNKLLEEETFEVMLKEIKDVASIAGKDTLPGGSYEIKYNKGIFTGSNLIKAILDSKIEHIKLFFKYENDVPANNMGNNVSFISTYASWIMNGTTLYSSSIKPYLLSLNEQTEKNKQIKNLYNQIKENNLFNEWISETLQDIRDENFINAQQTSLLIKEVAEVNDDKTYKGWAEFLLANIHQQKGNKIEAEKYLMAANNIFQQNDNYEGKAWIKSAQKKQNENTEIHVQMQDGHTLHYITAIAPNGKYFATGSEDNLIKIWNKISGKEIYTISYHTDKIIYLQYSPNGQYLVSVGADKQIAVWNAFNFQLINSYTSDGETQVAKISPDNKHIFIAEDSNLYVIKLFSDTLNIVKKLTLHKRVINDFAFFKNNPNLIYTCSDDSTFCRWDISKMEKKNDYILNTKVKSIIVSNNNRYVSFTTDDGVIRVLDLFTKEFIVGSNAFLECNYYLYYNKFAAMYAAQSFSTDSKLIVLPSHKDSFRIYNLADTYYRQYAYNTNGYAIRSTQFMPDGNDLLITSNAYDFGLMNVKGYDFDKQSALNNKKIFFYANQINKVQYTEDDNTIQYTITEGNYGKLNLSSANLFMNYNATINTPITDIICYQNDNYFPIKPSSRNNTLAIYDKESDSFLYTIKLDTTENVFGFAKSKDNNLIFVSGINGQIVGYNTTTNTTMFNINTTPANTAYVMYLFYDDFNERLFCKTHQDYVLIINGKTGIVTDTIFVDKARYVLTTKDRICITTGDGRLKFYNSKTLQYITGWQVNSKEIEALQMQFIPSKNQLLLQDSKKSIALYDMAVDSFLYQFYLGYNCRSIAINHKETEFAIAGADGTIRLYDLTSGKLKVNIFLPFKKEPFITDTLNHYYSSKNALNAINIAYNNQVYPYEQFDLKLNRPDIIFKALGKTEEAVIKNYYAAYLKRLKTLGINEKQLEATNKLQLPHVKLLNSYTLETTTSDSIYNFDVSFKDENYQLQSIQILVNNSPIFDVNGKSIAALNVKEYTTSVKAPLATGVNTIKVYCTNEIGVTSLKESFTVLSTYESKVHKPTVYFVGIGVANYKDSLYNLTYSAKDIRDLAKDIANSYKTYQIDTLLNEQVTKENILKLKNKLLKTTPDDRVIVAITGHGLLSDSLDFYYATYDIDFKKPEKRGLKYELIEKLLDNVPAQEKIMFIDACHSGALDKEELLAFEKSKKKKTTSTTDDKINVTGIASRSTIKIKNKQSKISTNSSFELMQRTFSDLSGSNGAVIVSAAGGMEYAFESAEWNNGVFTLAIREGLFLKYADTYLGGNKDGKISVEELVKYVNERVAYLTNEKQKPTQRRENIDFNWIIRY